MELIYRDLTTYMAQNIEDYEHRVAIALNVMDRNRCPIQFADNKLYTEMMDLVDEYCYDNDLDTDDIDIEMILFTLPA